jgi:hypothetical protein
MKKKRDLKIGIKNDKEFIGELKRRYKRSLLCAMG